MQNAVMLTRFRRTFLAGGGLLLLLTFLLVVIASHPWGGLQVILPKRYELIALAGLVLLTFSQLVAAARRRGWSRILPLLLLMPAWLGTAALLGFAGTFLLRSEINRVSLPDGHLIMLALEPMPTDTVFSLWEADGWRWRALVEPVVGITYSEDGSFTTDPALLSDPSEKHLLIRRGGIWTDCWSAEPRLTPCLPSNEPSPVSFTAGEWRARSSRIAALVGMAPTPHVAQ
jgi:hypothetical protein